MTSVAMSIAFGTRLGPYEIAELLGAGGMGEVYRARDTRLGRDVAIKVLPAFSSGDAGRVRRFEQEARAAAALSHPNICAIYDIGNHDGALYIVMECLKGQPLSERVAAGPVAIDALIEIAVDVAEALDAAHRGQVVHRDIKSANIFVVERGHAKVLDFGLAKTAVPVEPARDAEELTRTFDAALLTDPGVAIGTVAYMSPEQALGKPVDGRTDIFSFGVVLYEMATGRRPFAGPTNAAVFDAILNRAPADPVRLNPRLPDDLGRIIHRALEKDPDLRYQHASDLGADLKRLRRDGAVRSTGGSAAPAATEAAVDPQASAARPASDSAIVAGVLRRHRAGALIGAAAFVLATTVAGYELYLGFTGPAPASPPIASMQMTRLTTSGDVDMAAISPDGKYIAYDSIRNGQYALWLRQIGTESRIQIVPVSAESYRGVAFSPDGTFIYYSRDDEALSVWVLYRVPALGGTPQQILPDVDSPVAFSPDGRRMAFVRKIGDVDALVTADPDGSRPQVVASTRAPEFLNRGGLAWSRGGATIAVGAVVLAPVWQGELLEAPASGGTFTRLALPSSLDAISLDHLAWLPDGSGWLGTVIANPRHGNAVGQIWELPAGGAAPRRLTNDLSAYSGVSLAASGSSVVTVQGETSAAIWVAPTHGDGEPRQISTSDADQDGLGGLDWAPDGRIVYSSLADGVYKIRSMTADGADARVLSPSPDETPHVTADGRTIVFQSLRASGANLWRMNIDGSDARQLTQTEFTFGFDVSPDGKTLVYTSTVNGKSVLLKQPIDGGPPVPLDEEYTPVGSCPFSPDGTTVAIITSNGPAKGTVLRLVPFGGGKVVDVPESHLSFLDVHDVHWSADGRSVIVARTIDGVSNLWRVPIDGGPLVQWTHFTSQVIFAFALSRDGTRLAVSRGTNPSDAVLIRNVR